MSEARPVSNDSIPTHEQRDTLRGLIRCGAPLTDEQRDHLAQLLDEIGLTVQVCARATQRYTHSKELQDAYLVACWEPVGAAYAELVAAVAR